MMKKEKTIVRREPKAYLCSFLDQRIKKRYIYGGVAFLPLLVKLVDLCCNSRQPHRCPPYLVHSSVCIMTRLVCRADDDRLARTMQGWSQLAKLTPEARYCAVSRAI